MSAPSSEFEGLEHQSGNNGINTRPSQANVFICVPVSVTTFIGLMEVMGVCVCVHSLYRYIVAWRTLKEWHRSQNCDNGSTTSTH